LQRLVCRAQSAKLDVFGRLVVLPSRKTRGQIGGDASGRVTDHDTGLSNPLGHGVEACGGITQRRPRDVARGRGIRGCVGGDQRVGDRLQRERVPCAKPEESGAPVVPRGRVRLVEERVSGGAGATAGVEVGDGDLAAER
jgi:hypothetical protein